MAAESVYITVYQGILSYMKKGAMTYHALLTVKEVARHLRCHEHTVRRWIWEGKVASVKVGDLVRVPSAELDRITASRADMAKPKRRQKRCTGRDLLETLRQLRNHIDPEQVRELNRRMLEGEQPADWRSPLGRSSPR
jgi:excisionase family DNA binding protein